MKYVPKQGEIVYLSLDPQSGHEQRGRRPALVVSNDEFNRRTSLTMVCPITNTDNKFPLHVALNAQTKTTGFVLCEQLKSLDMESRKAEFIEKAPQDILRIVLDYLALCLKP